MQRQDTERRADREPLPGRRDSAGEGGLVAPEERTSYSPFDLEPDERSTRPASESWREGLVRGRASRTPLLLHGLVLAVVFAVAGILTAVILLIWLLG